MVTALDATVAESICAASIGRWKPWQSPSSVQVYQTSIFLSRFPSECYVARNVGQCPTWWSPCRI